MKAQEVTDIIRAIGKKIEEEKDFLTELDNVIGDATTASIWPEDSRLY